MVPDQLVAAKLIDRNRKLREIFEGAPEREKLEKVLEWLCRQVDCSLAAHLRQSEEGRNRFSVCFIQDQCGNCLSAERVPDRGNLLPPSDYNNLESFWVEPRKVEMPQVIRQKYGIVGLVRKVFFRLRREDGQVDLVALIFDQDAKCNDVTLEGLALTMSCLSCLLQRHAVSLQGERERKQREFLMHLYEGAIPGLDHAYTRVLEAVAELLECKRYAMWKVNYHSKTATLVAEYRYVSTQLPKVLDFAASFVGLAVEHATPLYFPNVFAAAYHEIVRLSDREFRSLVAVPVLELQSGSRVRNVTHVLIMYPSDPDYEFDERLFRVASERIAIYLHNAETVEQHRFVQLLLECSAGSPGLQAYLENVVALIVRQLPVQGCSIFYFDDVRQKLLLGATSGLVDDPPAKSVMYDPDETAATAMCFKTGSSARHDDIRKLTKDQMMHKFKERTKEKVKSFLAVPIRNPAGIVTGVVRCANKLDPSGAQVDYFSDVDQQLLEFVGRIVGYHIELRLQDRRRNDSLERMMHEVYSTASSIRVTAELLRKRGSTMVPMKFNYMLSNIEEYARLWDWLAESMSLFTLSKPERLRKYEKREFSFMAVLKEVQALVRPIARSRGRKFDKIKLPSQQSRLVGDQGCLVIILMNLIANAVKYFDESKCDDFQVDVQAGLWDQYTCPKSQKRYRNVFVLKVSDWGIGVPRFEEPRIFEPGFRGMNAIRVDDTGQGLGLSLVKTIIQDVEGEVFLEQNCNPTTFTVVIPQKGQLR